MIVLAAVGSDAYNIVLVLHILAAIVGFGAVTLNGIYGQQAKSRKGAEGLAISEANYLVTSIAEYFIYGVLVTGILLVLMSSDAWEFGQTWITLSIIFYLAALALSRFGLFPRVRKMLALQHQLVDMGPSPAGATPGGPPPQVVEIEELGKRVGMISGGLHLALVVLLVLMVFKPGI